MKAIKTIKTMKRIISFIIIAAIMTTSVLSFSSCEKPEIYNLIEMLLNNKQDGSAYNLNGELNIKINKDYLYNSGIISDFRNTDYDAVPDKINIKLDGELNHLKSSKICRALIKLYILDYQLEIYCQNDALYFTNNEITRVILDLLTVTGFVDFPVKEIFTDIAYADTEKLFYVDLKDFDSSLSWFEQYAEHIENAFTITSKFETSKKDKPDSASAEKFDTDKLMDFSEIKSKTEKRLLKVSGYRYAELSIVLSSDDYIHILASRENGEREILESFKSDIRMSAAIAKIKREPASLWTENIIPMRYILELMGEDVNWDNSEKKPYIIRKDKKVHFNAAIVNSRSYINLTQILSTALYAVSADETGDYLEFKIMRQYLPQ